MDTLTRAPVSNKDVVSRKGTERMDCTSRPQ